ncbi:hypothetical protein D3C75_1191660 [compost metagenome]
MIGRAAEAIGPHAKAHEAESSGFDLFGISGGEGLDLHLDTDGLVGSQRREQIAGVNLAGRTEHQQGDGREPFERR